MLIACDIIVLVIIMDTVTKQQRSINMSHIKGKNTSIEIKARKYLYKKGFRYRVNVKTLPGKPDIVLKKYKTIIFVNGCFWHRHINCKYATTPKSNTDYWNKKFQRNVENDNKHYKELKQMGWHIIILWECDLKDNFEETMQQVVNTLLD